MSAECEQLFELLGRIETELGSLRVRMDDLDQAIGQIETGGDREQVLDWVVGGLKNMGITGVAVLGMAGVAVANSPVTQRTRHDLERL